MELFDPANLKRLFLDRPPTKQEAVSLDVLAHSAIVHATTIGQECPSGPERTLALRHMEMSLFYARSAIMRHEPAPPKEIERAPFAPEAST